jgi:hypothetical protein
MQSYSEYVSSSSFSGNGTVLGIKAVPVMQLRIMLGKDCSELQSIVKMLQSRGDLTCEEYTAVDRVGQMGRVSFAECQGDVSSDVHDLGRFLRSQTTKPKEREVQQMKLRDILDTSDSSGLTMSLFTGNILGADVTVLHTNNNSVQKATISLNKGIARVTSVESGEVDYRKFCSFLYLKQNLVIPAKDPVRKLEWNPKVRLFINLLRALSSEAGIQHKYFAKQMGALPLDGDGKLSNLAMVKKFLTIKDKYPDVFQDAVDKCIATRLTIPVVSGDTPSCDGHDAFSAIAETFERAKDQEFTGEEAFAMCRFAHDQRNQDPDTTKFGTTAWWNAVPTHAAELLNKNVVPLVLSGLFRVRDDGVAVRTNKADKAIFVGIQEGIGSLDLGKASCYDLGGGHSLNHVSKTDYISSLKSEHEAGKRFIQADTKCGDPKIVCSHYATLLEKVALKQTISTGKEVPGMRVTGFLDSVICMAIEGEEDFEETTHKVVFNELNLDTIAFAAATLGKWKVKNVSMPGRGHAGETMIHCVRGENYDWNYFLLSYYSRAGNDAVMHNCARLLCLLNSSLTETLNDLKDIGVPILVTPVNGELVSIPLDRTNVPQKVFFAATTTKKMEIKSALGSTAVKTMENGVLDTLKQFIETTEAGEKEPVATTKRKPKTKRTERKNNTKDTRTQSPITTDEEERVRSPTTSADPGQEAQGSGDSVGQTKKAMRKPKRPVTAVSSSVPFPDAGTKDVFPPFNLGAQDCTPKISWGNPEIDLSLFSEHN